MDNSNTVFYCFIIGQTAVSRAKLCTAHRPLVCLQPGIRIWTSILDFLQTTLERALWRRCCAAIPYSITEKTLRCP